jgi:hypothetical protein
MRASGKFGMVTRMRRVVTALTGIAGGTALAVVSVLAVAAPAQAQTSDAICYNNHCWNNWNGNTGIGNPIRFYDYNSGTIINSGWQIKFVGYVTNQAPVWPFINGSNQNNRYNGLPVYQIKWNPDQARCASQYPYSTSTHDGPLVIDACFTSANKYAYPTQQLFVYSSLHYLVAVWATNQEYRNGDPSYVPTFVGNRSGNNGNGANVWVNDNTYVQWAFQPNN